MSKRKFATNRKTRAHIEVAATDFGQRLLIRLVSPSKPIPVTQKPKSAAIKTIKTRNLGSNRPHPDLRVDYAAIKDAGNESEVKL